jgi:hypothetical protein
MAKKAQTPPAARQAGQEHHGRIRQPQGLRQRPGAAAHQRHSVVVADTPENRGMINKVSYLLQVEEV